MLSDREHRLWPQLSIPLDPDAKTASRNKGGHLTIIHAWSFDEMFIAY
jgi:hypothetical protein